MKALQFLLVLSISVMIGCKKDKGTPEEDGPGGDKRLTDIVPQAYLDEAKQMGFPIYTGNNPPNISDTYRLAPWRFDAINTDKSDSGMSPGDSNTSGFAVSFSSQTATAIAVSYTGYYEGFEKSKPFVIGSGNHFTVCRYVGMDACGANFRYDYMQLLSGTKEGNVLKNVKMATIGLGSANPEAYCQLEGEITIYSDADGVSNPE